MPKSSRAKKRKARKSPGTVAVPTGRKFAKFGPKKRARYLAALAKGNTRTRAAKSAGVSYELVRLYRHATAGFEQEEEEAEALAAGDMENALFNSGMAGNVTAQQVWLYNRVPDRWKDRRVIAHTGADGGPVRQIDEHEYRVTIRAERLAEFERTYNAALGPAADAPEANPVDGVREPLHSPHPDGETNPVPVAPPP